MQIERGACNGSQSEGFSVVALARHLVVHSARGRLIWITDHSIESCPLNGGNFHIHWSTDYFSFKKGI